MMKKDDESESVVARLNIAGREPIDVFGPVTVGRDPRADGGQPVEVDSDPLISKSHFAISFVDGSPTITDLGSSNGTFLHDTDGETAVPTDRAIPLPLAAEVEFGDQRLRVELVDDVDPLVDLSATTDRGGAAPAVAPIAPPDPWGIGDASTDVAREHAESIHCSSCERRLPGNAKFCDSCGSPTNAAPQYDDWAPSASEPDDATPSSASAVHRPQLPPEPMAAGPAPPVGAPSAPPPPVEGHARAAEHHGGAPQFVEGDAPAPNSGGAAKKLALGVGAVAIAAIVVFGLSQLFGRDDGSSSGTFLVVPESLDERWSEPVDRGAQNVNVGAESVYLFLQSGDETEITSLALADGEEKWQASFDAEGFIVSLAGEFDDVVVFGICGRSCELIGVDAATGDELWTEQNDDAFGAVESQGRVRLQTAGRVELIDPATGDRVVRVRADRIDQSGEFVLATESDEVEVFDADLDSIFGPIEIDADASAMAFDGARLIVAVDDELQFLDAEGEVTRESRLGVSSISSIRVVADDNLIVDTDEGVLSIDPIDGRADERWSTRGALSSVFDVDGGAVVLVGDDRNDDTDVLDAQTGDRRFTIGDAQSSRAFVVPGKNAAVVLSRDVETGRETGLEAIDWTTGDELWTETVDGLLVLGDDVVVELDYRGEVTLFD